MGVIEYYEKQGLVRKISAIDDPDKVLVLP